MVDLLNIYHEAGLLPRRDQLPDYLPLFLEFLSTRDEETAANWLASVAHILLLLAERLRKRQAWEADLFDALLVIAGAELADDRLQAQVAAEEDDSSLTTLDRSWEDKEIRFDGLDVADDCETAQVITATPGEPAPTAAPVRHTPEKNEVHHEHP